MCRLANSIANKAKLSCKWKMLLLWNSSEKYFDGIMRNKFVNVTLTLVTRTETIKKDVAVLFFLFP